MPFQDVVHLPPGPRTPSLILPARWAPAFVTHPLQTQSPHFTNRKTEAWNARGTPRFTPGLLTLSLCSFSALNLKALSSHPGLSLLVCNYLPMTRVVRRGICSHRKGALHQSQGLPSPPTILAGKGQPSPSSGSSPVCIEAGSSTETLAGA